MPTNEDLLVAVILDRSGSMQTVRDATIGAFNRLLSDLTEQTGRTRLTLTQFDSQSIDVIADAVDVREILPLTIETYVPRGGTPLYDAAGRTLAATEARAASLGWTGSVMVVVITDGKENASREWTRESVFARVKELEARGWAFIYLGAGPDAYRDAGAIGVAAGSTSRWVPKGKNVGAMGKGLAQQASRLRKGESMPSSLISAAERAEMEEE